MLFQTFSEVYFSGINVDGFTTFLLALVFQTIPTHTIRVTWWLILVSLSIRFL